MTETSNNLSSLLEEAAALDIKLWVEDGRLRVNAPQGALTAELKERLSANKPALIEFLSHSDESNSFDIQPVDRQGHLPPTLGQQRIWSLARMEESSSVYNVPTCFVLHGKLRRDALEFALNEIGRRHEILRSNFIGDNADSLKVTIRDHVAVVVPITDLSRDLAKFKPQQRQKMIDKLLQEEVRKPFDLSDGSLWRVRLFRLGQGSHVLAATMHHIIFDGMSKAIFLRELGEFYDAFIAGNSEPAPDLPIQFVDYAAWQKKRLSEDVIEKQLDYWREKFSGEVPPLVTPNQKKRLPQKGKAGSVHLWSFHAASKLARLCCLLRHLRCSCSAIPNKKTSYCVPLWPAESMPTSSR